MLVSGLKTALFSAAGDRASVRMSGAHADLIHSCLDCSAARDLDSGARRRVADYLQLLLAYNERTNVYSKSAYPRLPFHVADCLTLATHTSKLVAQQRQSGESRDNGGVLDLGSGSGLPSLLIACVVPEVPVYALESKSRKTRFLSHAASKIGLERYFALTQNVNELSRTWVFDVDVVTAKAFKPLPEVVPIAKRCVRKETRLLVPISEGQVREFELDEGQLAREGDFLYFSQQVSPSHGSEQRKLATPGTAPSLGRR